MNDSDYELEQHERAVEQYQSRLARERRQESAQADSDSWNWPEQHPGRSVAKAAGRPLRIVPLPVAS